MDSLEVVNLAPTLIIPLAYLYLPFLLSIVGYAAISTWALTGQVISKFLNTRLRMRIYGIAMSSALVYTAIGLIDLSSLISSLRN